MPCFFSNCCFLPVNINKSNNRVVISKIARSKLMNCGILIGAIKEVIPKTQRMLKIFEPTIFPIAKSTSFFNAAVIEVTSSGNEVPIAIIVAEIKNSLRPNC